MWSLWARGQKRRWDLVFVNRNEEDKQKKPVLI
jgi:hypothetical protein